MDAATLTGLESVISDPRFSRYLRRYQGDRAMALRLYTWNIAVSSALWGPICILEVAVRNAIHNQLVERTGRGDWWNDSHVVLLDRERDAITSAESTLIGRGNPNPNSDQIVAATTFGLWTGLTGEGIPRHRLYSYETTFWQPRLHKAFPHAGSVRRKQIHAQLDAIRVLRNRIAHHEPIYASPLPHLFDDIMQVAGFVHPDAREYIESHSRTKSVVDGMEAAIKNGDTVF